MFEKFVKKLSLEINRDIPGFSAQKMMAPLGRRPPTDYLEKGVVPRNSAVLILLYSEPKPFEIKTVLILRPDHEGGTHSGQIAFPGGGVDDSDKGFAETALRETEEEIGVNRNSVSILGALTPLYIPVSNYMVHPYVGAVSTVPQFILNPREVKGLVEVSIDKLVLEGNKKTVEKYLKVKGSAMQVPCYDINGQIIWGATAMIISEFVEIIRRIK